MHDVTQLACEFARLIEQNCTEARVWEEVTDGAPDHIKRTALLMAVRSCTVAAIANFVERTLIPPVSPARLWLQLGGVDYDERTCTAVFSDAAGLYAFKRQFPSWSVAIQRNRHTPAAKNTAI